MVPAFVPLLVVIVCGIIMAGFPLYSFFKCAFSDELSGGQKALWLLFIFFISPIGAVLYSFYYPHNGFHVGFRWAYIFLCLVGLALVLLAPKSEKPSALNKKDPTIVLLMAKK